MKLKAVVFAVQDRLENWNGENINRLPVKLTDDNTKCTTLHPLSLGGNCMILNIARAVLRSTN